MSAVLSNYDLPGFKIFQFHTITDTLYAWKVEPNVLQPPLGGFPFNISFTYVFQCLIAHLMASRSPDQNRFLQIETDRQPEERPQLEHHLSSSKKCGNCSQVDIDCDRERR